MEAGHRGVREAREGAPQRGPGGLQLGLHPAAAENGLGERSAGGQGVSGEPRGAEAGAEAVAAAAPAGGGAVPLEGCCM